MFVRHETHLSHKSRNSRDSKLPRRKRKGSYNSAHSMMLKASLPKATGVAADTATRSHTAVTSVSHTRLLSVEHDMHELLSPRLLSWYLDSPTSSTTQYHTITLPAVDKRVGYNYLSLLCLDVCFGAVLPTTYTAVSGNMCTCPKHAPYLAYLVPKNVAEADEDTQIMRVVSPRRSSVWIKNNGRDNTQQDPPNRQG